MVAYNPAYGWRLDRIPGRRVTRLEEDGEGMALPLWIVLNGEHRGDGQLRMSLAEAEQLHAELCRALGGYDPQAGIPPCRDDSRDDRVGWA